MACKTVEHFGNIVGCLHTLQMNMFKTEDYMQAIVHPL